MKPFPSKGDKGDPGDDGSPGPAPSGTGLVSVTAGVLDTPSTLAARLAAAASSNRTALGLGNVDNTSDANKPVSTAQATAISGAVAAEASTRSSADTALSTAISNEATTRASADSTLTSSVAAAASAASTAQSAATAAGTLAAAALPKAGGTMSGAIAMGGNKVTGSAVPSAAGEAMVVPASVANGDTFIWSGGTLVRLPKGTDGQVYTLASGLPSWATVSGGVSAARSGTFASIGTASSYPGAMYYVTSGAGKGDVYESDGTSWRLVAYDQLGDLAPLYRWKLNETSGTSFANSGSAGTAPLTLTGTATLGVPTGRQVGLYSAGTATTADGGAAPSSTRQLSLSVWWRPTATGAGTFSTIFMWQRSSGGPAIGILIANDETAPTRPRVSLTTDGTNERAWRCATPPLNAFAAGGLYHIVAVWDGNLTTGAKIACYVNGFAMTGGAWNVDPGTDIAFGTGSWRVGSVGGFALNGVAAEPQVYDGSALTQAQAIELYSRGAGFYPGQ